jgi:hypothetical protein
VLCMEGTIWEVSTSPSREFAMDEPHSACVVGYLSDVKRRQATGCKNTAAPVFAWFFEFDAVASGKSHFQGQMPIYCS